MKFCFISLAKSRSCKVFLLYTYVSYVLSLSKSRRVAAFYRCFAPLRLCAIILVSIFTLQSCSSGNDSKKVKVQQIQEPVSPKENFLKGQLIEKVICKNDTSQSYALYLPENYSIEKKYPIIYAFDPHAAGRLPVINYKDLAEKYGYIIAGSNNSKNGTSWDESQSIATNLFADAGNRLSINTQRIYVLGFSGGARVANGLAITNGSIEGAICCGAAAPATNSNSPRNNYSFFGIVGNEDFNYTEMRKYDMVDLAGHNIKHALITFDGKHEWPPKETMDEAFWWIELNEMRKNSSYKNDSLIAKHIQPELKQVVAFQQKNQVFEAYKLCQTTINFYDGLADLSSCFAIYKTVQANPEISKRLKQEEEDWDKEENIKKEYIKAFQTQNLNWWDKNIATLNQKIKTGKDKNEVLINKRTLGYLSLVAYMQTSGALKQNMLPAADFFGKIYILVDPTNNEAHYLMASISAEKGDKTGAIKSLKLAVKNGFKDTNRLQSDSAFNSIKNLKEFGDVITIISQRGKDAKD